MPATPERVWRAIRAARARWPATAGMADAAIRERGAAVRPLEEVPDFRAGRGPVDIVLVP